jgi:hypothetical protein
MPYKPRELEHMFVSKLHMVVKNADHTWFILELNGLPTISTKLPNHKADIGEKLESKIHKQLHVRKLFFHSLVDCSKSRADYEKQIRENPYPPLVN